MLEADLYTAKKCLVKFSQHWSHGRLAGWPPLLNRRPFGETLRLLRMDRGWSLEDLAYETRRAAVGEDGKGYSIGYLGQLERGIRRPTLAVMTAVAVPLQVDPRETFPEMRLQEARRRLDEQGVGLEVALANLDELSDQLAARPPEGVLRVPGPPEGSQLEQLLRDASPNRQDQPRSPRKRPASRRKRA